MLDIFCWDPGKLAANGLSIDTVKNALAQAASNQGVIQLYSMGTMSDAAATEKVSQAGIADNLTSMLSVLKSFRS